jgi:hypothetical protein
VSVVLRTPRFITERDVQEVVKFPKVSGRGGDGERRYLPEDFDGDPTLVLLTFNRQQRAVVSQWREFAADLADRYDTFDYVQLHVAPRGRGLGPPALATMAPGPVSAGPRTVQDDRRILVFVDKRWFQRSLGILGETSVYAMLVDDGYVVRQAAGMLTRDIAQGLESLLSEWDAAQARTAGWNTSSGPTSDADAAE